jgi:cellulose biosynthesis protein BcsQ
MTEWTTRFLEQSDIFQHHRTTYFKARRRSMIVGFVQEKGGVGKTTLSIHAATWLARQGHRVALMDLDTQGGVSHFLGMDPADDVAELLRSVLFLRPDRRPGIASFLTPFPLDQYTDLVLVRGYTASSEVEASLRQPGRPPAGKVLTEALAPLTQRGVIVVIDTGPYAGKLQEAVLDAADHIFTPGIPEGATEAGILKVAQHLHDLGRTITGLIPTRVITTSKKHRSTIADWQRIRGLGPLVYYDPPRGLVGLPQRVVWSQLYRVARPIWDVGHSEVKTSRSDLETAWQDMAAVLHRLTFDTGLGRKER